jgi:hypothetical protein
MRKSAFFASHLRHNINKKITIYAMAYIELTQKKWNLCLGTLVPIRLFQATTFFSFQQKRRIDADKLKSANHFRFG